MKKKKLEVQEHSGTILEYAQADASARLDRENAVLHGVKILGFVSLNGRRYAAEALERASSLYENAKVNVNHPRHSPQAPRDYQDRIGNIRNVRFRKNEGLYADFHFNPRHPLAEQLMWDAEHAPENVGFSHNIVARTVPQKDGTLLVEEISLVRSVDLVADPATTHGLFESQEAVQMEFWEKEETEKEDSRETLEKSFETVPQHASGPFPLENSLALRLENTVSVRNEAAENSEVPGNSDTSADAAECTEFRKIHSQKVLGESVDDGKDLLEALQTEIGSLQEEIGSLQEEIGSLQEEIGSLRRQFLELLRFTRKSSVPVCRTPQTAFRENGLSMMEFVNRLKSSR